MSGKDGGGAIDRELFLMAFGRDVDFHDTYPQVVYLDRKTGDVIWIYGSDHDAEMEVGIPAEENRREREAIETEPDRYLEIPGLDHDDHHRILRRFLLSDWTRDKERRQKAEDAYRGSIGKWKRDVGDEDAVDAFYAFRETEIVAMGEEFLRENGIEPIWKSFGERSPAAG